MRIWMLSLLGALLVCSAAVAADTTADKDASADVAVETSAPVTLDSAGNPVGDVDATSTADTGDATVSADSKAEPKTSHSLRDEYRQWRRASAEAPRHSSRTPSSKRVDSVNDLDSVGRDIEDTVNEDVANTDRDRYADGSYRSSADRADYDRTTSREVDRYADYPEYDNDAVDADRIGDRMYDDYDRGTDHYWSRSYGDDRYYDSRQGGCPCNSCSKCGRTYGSCGKCGGQCGESKCGSCSKCMSHKPAMTYVACDKCERKCSSCHRPAMTYTPCDKCGVSKCGCHKPAASCNKCGKCNKCDKCGKCGSKCSCGKASRKCSKC